jgi:hypothetical protein
MVRKGKQMKIKKYTFKCIDGIMTTLEVSNNGFTLWSDSNWLLDASMIKKDKTVRLCKQIKLPWKNQRFDFELVPKKLPKGSLNQWNEHIVTKVKP